MPGVHWFAALTERMSLPLEGGEVGVCLVCTGLLH